MKIKIISLAIFSILITSALSAQDMLKERHFNSANKIAVNLVEKFDMDKSDALNKLELSEAVTYLKDNYPLLVIHLDYTSGMAEFSAPPKIAYNLVVGFDSNSDVQLTEAELSLAISYLRRLNRVSSDLFAMSE